MITLHGGPLDGMTFPDPGGDHPGAYMIVPGELARAIYEPEPGGDPGRWHFCGWIGDVPE